MTLTTTGVSGLDAQLGGGVPRGTTLLLIAEPGNALGMFSEQFSGGGLEVGDAVYYYEFDRPVSTIQESVFSFVHSKNGKPLPFRLIDGYAAAFGKSAPAKGAEAYVHVMPQGDPFQQILAQVSQGGGGRPYRLVVESLSSLTRPENEAQVTEFMRRLVYLGHELGGVQLVTLVKGLHSKTFETHMRHLASGVLEIGSEQKGFGIYSYLLVSKLLNVRDPVRLLLFKETDKGLWLESTKRVF